MYRILLLALASLAALSGCAASTTPEQPAPDKAQTEESLAQAVAAWDEAHSSGDAQALIVSARTIPWFVVSDCGPNLENAQREALVTHGDEALAALADAEEQHEALLDDLTIIGVFEDYVENVRLICL